ncbi:MAG TPA: glycine betaine ABC transporter substrate-binding protein, partial [Candidatus Limnocylindrales bacterium]|nr:glycine betaine ABC transporter substrate-binding protein [Candidatus Limnocylindrales bacterium]
MRSIRSAALGATLLALLAAACTSGGGGNATTIAGTLVLGGPPECPQRPFCAKGLTDTYGISFKEFKPLDAGGPITVEAVKGGDVDVGLLFTSDPAIAANGFVLLEDDKHLQLADNLVPVVRQEVLDASPGLADLLNGIMAKLSQAELTNLNKSVTVDGQDPDAAAQAWLTANGFLPGAGGSGKGKVVVGSTNFYEQEILGELFAQTLAANGYEVEKKFQLGNREIVFPALESGEIDVLAEYAATALEFVNEGAGEASTDPQATADKLAARLKDRGIAVLDFAAATDQNGFVVTKATADKYGLT